MSYREGVKSTSGDAVARVLFSVKLLFIDRRTCADQDENVGAWG